MATGTKIGDLFVQVRTQGMKTSTKQVAGFGVGFGAAAGLAGMAVTAIIGSVKAMGRAVTSAFTDSISAAMDFETQLAKVSTMLSSETMPMMARFKTELKGAAAAWGQSTETLSDGLYNILSASIPAEEAMKVLNIAAGAAVGGFTDTNTAADALTTVLNSYQIAASEAADISDWMFSIVKRGKLTYAELAQNIGTVAATASVAGLKLNELGAMMSTLTRNGIKASNATVAIQGVLQAFLKPADDAKKAAEAYGIELSTETLRTEGLIGVLKRLQGVRAEDLAKMFPNIRGLKGIAAALQDVTGFETDLAGQMERTGEAMTAQEKVTATLAFQWSQMKEQLNNVWKMIGEKLKPVFVKFLDWFMGEMPAITAWIESTLIPIMKTMLQVTAWVVRSIMTLLKPVLWVITKVTEGLQAVGIMDKTSIGVNGAERTPGIQTVYEPEEGMTSRPTSSYSDTPAPAGIAPARAGGQQKTYDKEVAGRLDKLIDLWTNSGTDRTLDYGPTRA